MLIFMIFMLILGIKLEDVKASVMELDQKAVSKEHLTKLIEKRACKLVCWY